MEANKISPVSVFAAGGRVNTHHYLLILLWIMILSMPACIFPIVNGKSRTVMQTSQTGSTLCFNPDWFTCFHVYRIHRTVFCTQPAANTVLINSKPIRCSISSIRPLIVKSAQHFRSFHFHKIPNALCNDFICNFF